MAWPKRVADYFIARLRQQFREIGAMFRGRFAQEVFEVGSRSGPADALFAEPDEVIDDRVHYRMSRRVQSDNGRLFERRCAFGPQFQNGLHEYRGSSVVYV